MGKKEELARWVAKRHDGQLIRRSGEPYINHLLAVAELSQPALELGYEIGLCHDVLEDTSTTPMQLLEALTSLGYQDNAANLIVSCVLELTDVFTVSAYPGLSKSERKEREVARLMHISPTAQTVKYADLSYNINWVLRYDRKNARSYLLKKQRLLAGLTRGDHRLKVQVLHLINQALLTNY